MEFAPCFVEFLQVGVLQVLDELEFEALRVGEFANARGNGFSSGDSRSAVTPPGLLRIMRTPNLKSSIGCSSHLQPHASCADSFTDCTFPKSRRAAAAASFLDIPVATNSSVFSSTCSRISSERSLY
jgi:hypothetical protein